MVILFVTVHKSLTKLVACVGGVKGSCVSYRKAVCFRSEGVSLKILVYFFSFISVSF